MKKRLSFSQLTVLGLALIPAQNTITSSTHEQLAAQTPASLPNTAAQQSGFFAWFGGSSNYASSKVLTTQEQLLADIIAAAQDESLVTDGSINEKFTKGIETAVLAGYISSALTKISSSRLESIKQMLTKAEVQRDAFLAQDLQSAKTIEQLLLAAESSQHISVPQVKKVQAQCKEGRDCFNVHVANVIKAGHNYSALSQDERAKMDAALMAGGGTKAFTGQTSPRQKPNEYLKQFAAQSKEPKTLELTGKLSTTSETK